MVEKPGESSWGSKSVRQTVDDIAEMVKNQRAGAGIRASLQSSLHPFTLSVS